MLVSIITPAHRAKALFPETIRSVEAQTHAGWEWIIVEDGSDDGTRELVADLAARNPTKRIVYERHPESRGPSAARNTAMALAQGDVFAFVDSDDCWAPNHLEVCLAALGPGGADAVYSSVQKFDQSLDRHLELWGPSEEEREKFPASLFYTNFITPSAVALRRTIYDRIGGFDVRLRAAEDHDYWIRLLREGFRFSFSPEVTAFYRKNHGGALTSNFAFLIEWEAAALLKHLDWDILPLQERRRHVAYLHEIAGRQRLREQPLQAARAFFQAWQLAPRTLRYAAHAGRALALAPLTRLRVSQ